MRRPILLSLLLIALAAASWWLAGPEREPPQEITHQGPRQVDYYLRGLEVTTMDTEGRPARTLKADLVKHFADDETTELSQPQLTVHQPGEPPWVVRSEGGWVSADGGLILLSGTVNIDREAAEGIRPFHVVTRDLRVQPRQDYAETDEQVRVRSNSDRLDATGMQAWFRHPSRIKFLADVKGYYAPP